MTIYSYTYTGVEAVSMPAESLGADSQGGPQSSVIQPGQTVVSSTPINHPDFTPV